MRFILFSLLLMSAFKTNAQYDTTGPIDMRVINAVVHINKDGATGTGFLYRDNSGRSFLITNKHMIGEWSPVEQFHPAKSIELTLYGQDAGTLTVKIQIPLVSKNNKLLPAVKIHSDPKIDIAAVEITHEIANYDISKTNFFSRPFLLSIKNSSTTVTYGSQVFAIGYPAGIRSFTTNQPVVKTAFVASSIDGTLKVKQTIKKKDGTFKITISSGKIFLIDGQIIGGNSGGPVVTSQSVIWREMNGNIEHTKNNENYIIGIVSSSFSDTGISIVYSSEHIIEVVDLYR